MLPRRTARVQRGSQGRHRTLAAICDGGRAGGNLLGARDPDERSGETIGALNLFSVGLGRIADRDLPLGKGMAQIAALALLQERALRETRGVVCQLEGALNSRILIEQAKGVLAERAKVDVDVAFSKLRGHARSQNLRLSDVARDLIDGLLDAAALLPAST